MESEFHERLQRLLVTCERMLEAVRQLEVVGVESRVAKRVNVLKDRVSVLENSSE
jgi:hypothetical protein